MPPLCGGMGLGISTGDSLQRRRFAPSLLPHGRGACRRPKREWGTSSVPRFPLGFPPPSPDQGCGPGPGEEPSLVQLRSLRYAGTSTPASARLRWRTEGTEDSSHCVTFVTPRLRAAAAGGLRALPAALGDAGEGAVVELRFLPLLRLFPFGCLPPYTDAEIQRSDLWRWISSLRTLVPGETHRRTLGP